MDLLSSLTRHALKTEYQDLPREAIEAAKKSLVDILGTSLAGSSLAEYSGLVDLVSQMGGREESSLIPWGNRVPFTNAVMVNAALARARDFDEVHPVSGVHPCATVIPTALAVSEWRGGISGREFLTAVAVGVDFTCRMRMADNTTTGANGWSSDTYGPFGAAATAGKILKFTEQEMRSALGFAYAQASAGYQILQSPGYSAVNQGLAARSGALSALLAQRGLSGPEDVFEGKYGFYRLYLGGKYDPAKALARLGEEYEGSHLSFKAYPCCLFTHGPVEAVKEILRTHAAQKDSFSRLIVRTNRSAHNLCCEPLPEKRRPSSRRSAMFSIPYVLGNYLVKGRVLFEDFQEDKIGDPRVLQMASKVDPEIDPVLDRVGTASSPSIVEVVLSDGRKYSARIDHIKGHPQNPMEFDECAAKFKQCAAYSARAISGRQLEECIAMIKHLEEVEDVRSILKGLIG